MKTEFVDIQAAIAVLHLQPGIVSAIARAGLLGTIGDDDLIRADALQDYVRYGTQWNAELSDQGLQQRYFRQLQAAPFADYPLDMSTRFFAAPDDTLPEDFDADVGCLMQFYLRPNPLMWAPPGAIGLVHSPLLAIGRRRDLTVGARTISLYPGPDGCLAMGQVAIWGLSLEDALAAGYDALAPVLDELTIRFDVALPIAHTCYVGIPSGVVCVPGPKWGVRTAMPPDYGIREYPYADLRPAVALYREGASSNNVFSRFLSFWKALECARSVRRWRPSPLHAGAA